MIEAQNIFKSFNNGSVKVLKGVSLKVQSGNVTAILGASGSGKSTLMSVLSGGERPDSGKVFCGEELTKMTDKQLTQFRREKIGFIFQQYYLLPHLSVEKNVKLGADLAGNKNFKEIIEAVGLIEKLNRKPAELSGGEQQRVCIARALAKNPEVLFMDEPTGALDEACGREVLNFIWQLKKKKPFTAVMVTHNENIAEMADTVIRMNSGRVVSEHTNASPKTAYEIGW